MFKVKSLYAIAKQKVKSVYVNNWAETNVLPKPLQQDLLNEWLYCDETIHNLADHPEPFMEGSWEDIQPITPQVFVWLMTHPDEVPTFVYEKTHVVFTYYIKKDFKNNLSWRLCKDCFSRISKYYSPCSANKWLEQEIGYTKITNHQIVNGENVLKDIIWDCYSWCDECTCATLFNIYDEFDCGTEYDFHRYKRTKWDTDSESDSEDVFKTEIIVGNRMDSDMYMLYKKNNICDY